jgi:CheY-like chemotaxis protein
MEAVGQLTGGIAHDFNNLLQGIIGSLDIMERRLAQGRTQELARWFDGAKSSAQRAAALTHRLLAFSRRQPLDPRPVQANPLIASMEDLLRRTLGETITLDLRLNPALWLTRCDPNQLENAILNLAINARDAMPDGGTLVIETDNATVEDDVAARHRDLPAGDYITIRVADTGTGMDRETAERAFEPFFTTKPIGQGTGLGLSMIYGFARQSEGIVQIESAVGNGTAIRLFLPRLADQAIAPLREDELPELKRTRNREVVLIVEDEPIVRSLIVDILDDLGYRTIEAATGNAGLAALGEADRIDLLITDIGLPDINGRQVADEARRLRPGLQILFMTGYAENAALAKGFLLEGMELITKPFSVDALAGKISEMITPER